MCEARFARLESQSPGRSHHRPRPGKDVSTLLAIADEVFE
jgi:hypothetical protein